MRWVLVVEDHAPTLAAIRRQLATSYEVITCDSLAMTESSLSAMADPPLAVITDVRLGHGPDGVEVVRYTRARFGRVPALVITGLVEMPTETVERLTHLGAGVRFHRKPIEVGTLVRFIEHAEIAELLPVGDVNVLAAAAELVGRWGQFT